MILFIKSFLSHRVIIEKVISALLKFSHEIVAKILVWLHLKKTLNEFNLGFLKINLFLL